MERDVLVDVAVLGRQVQEFLASDVGKYLATRITQEYNTGVEELKHVAAHDAAAVMTAQNKVLRAEMLQQWLQDAVSSGLKALAILEERDD